MTRTVDEMKASFSEREQSLERMAAQLDRLISTYAAERDRLRSCPFEVTPEEFELLVSEAGTRHVSWADTDKHGHRIVAGVPA